MKRTGDARDDRNGKRTKVKGGAVPPQKTKTAAPVKKAVSKPSKTDSKKKDFAKSAKTDQKNGKSKKVQEESEEEEDEFDLDDLSDSDDEKDQDEDIDMGGLSDEGSDDDEEDDEEDEEEKKPKAESNGKVSEAEKSMLVSHPKVWING